MIAKFAATLAMSTLIVTSAFAQDTGSQRWSGGYVGGFGGWTSFNSLSTDITGEEFGNSTPGAQEDASGNGWLGGGTLGYNIQNGNAVYGAELEVGYHSGDSLDVVNGDDGVLVLYDGLFGSLAGRLGYATGNTLIFVKGGLAFADITNAGGEFDGVQFGGFLGFDDNEAGSGQGLRFGYTLGGGFEYAIDANWSWKLEYAFTDFNDVEYDTFQGTNEPFRFEDTVHAVKFGINYKF